MASLPYANGSAASHCASCAGDDEGVWGLEAVQGVLVDGLVDSALRLQGHESAVVCGVRAGVAKGRAGNVTVRVSLLVEDGALAGGEGGSDHFAQEFQVDLERLRSRAAGASTDGRGGLGVEIERVREGADEATIGQREESAWATLVYDVEYLTGALTMLNALQQVSRLRRRTRGGHVSSSMADASPVLTCHCVRATLTT